MTSSSDLAKLREVAEGDFQQLVNSAREKFDSLSPVDRALHLSDQRLSFARGQLGREPPRDVLADEVRRLRDALSSERERADRYRKALEQIANCGQSREPDHWKFRCMARETASAALEARHDAE